MSVDFMEEVPSEGLTRRGFSFAAFSALALGLAACDNEKAAQVLKTPEARFDNLSDYNFAPHYFEVSVGTGKARMHYIDEGERGAPVILCLHGQASWAYIYRKAIPIFVEAGFRIVAPDFIGFGRSDKLLSVEDYSFKSHVEWLKAFVRGMGFKDVTPIMFDWGGFFGLRAAGEAPELFDRLVLVNTQLPRLEEGPSEWFNKFRAMVLGSDEFPIGAMVNMGVMRGKLSKQVLAAYDAPFPDETYKTGPRAFPMFHPITEWDAPIGANRAAWTALGKFEKPVLTVFSEMTAKTAMPPGPLQSHIPGAKGQSHAIIKNAGFYLVEDAPEELAAEVIAFVQKNKG